MTYRMQGAFDRRLVSPLHRGRLMRSTRLLAGPLPVLLLTPLLLPAQGVNRYGNPPRVRPAPTTSAINVRDLQIRLYQFADDSMQGRQVGRYGNKKGTDYIAAELKRQGWKVNHKRVGRILREDNLLCLRKRKFQATTDSRHGFQVYPNVSVRPTPWFPNLPDSVFV